MVLLEVLVALAIIAGIAAALVGLSAQAADAVRHAGVAERDLRSANAFMHAVALWTRDDLDRRLGARRQGAWQLEIQRGAEELYGVTLRDSSGRTLLATTLYRPVDAR
jgi:type II secretory pathway pseudopilin PulG